MAPSNGFLSEFPPRVARTVRHGSAPEVPATLSQRVANLERELRIQFTRIAQLQAQLDLALGARRRPPEGFWIALLRSES